MLCSSGQCADVDSAWEQKKLEARKTACAKRDESVHAVLDGSIMDLVVSCQLPKQ
jgi:hypothetical protein